MKKKSEESFKYLLNIEGQIIFILYKSDRIAGEIYKYVSASQPTISKRLARLLDEGKICLETSSSDRRLSIYKLTETYRENLKSDDLYEVMTSLHEPIVGGM